MFFLLPTCVISYAGCGGGDKAAAPTALEVSVADVVKQDVSRKFEFVGQTAGAVDAEVRARVDGVLTGLFFEEGKEVKEGQLIYTIDDAPFRASVAGAKAALAEAESRLVKAEADLKRIRPLAEMNAVSKKDLDTAIAQEGVARSGVEAAKAGLESAEIELSYTQIKAPASGIIGLTKAKKGELVGKPPNPIILNTVSNLDPILVRFAVNEKDYLYFARLKQKRIEKGDAPEVRVLELVLADGSVHPQHGAVSSVDSQIDPQTGSLKVEASFPNPNTLVRPGQFAKVKTSGETTAGALLIPKKAIRDLQGQSQVFVVKQDDSVEQRTVVTGLEVADLQVIESGLNEGERVAVDGLQRLKSGMKISPKKVS